MGTCYLLRACTRWMEKLVESLGITRLSKSKVSEMARDLDAQVAYFRLRPLDAGPHTFVAADALVLKVREGGRVVGVIGANLPGAAWQRCCTHHAANLMAATRRPPGRGCGCCCTPSTTSPTPPPCTPGSTGSRASVLGRQRSRPAARLHAWRVTFSDPRKRPRTWQPVMTPVAMDALGLMTAR